MPDTTTQVSRPAPFIEKMGKTFGEGIMRLGAMPITTDPSDPTFAASQARMSGMAPTVAPQIGGTTGYGMGQQAQQAAATQAGLGQLTFGAEGQVTGMGAPPSGGVAGYQPYLTGAEGFGTAAAGLTGPGAGTGAGSISEYMSPYTSNVIQAMQDQMADVKAQQDIGRNAQTVGAGAFGGARSGVAQSVADTEYNRMVGQMVAQQQGQSFQQAQGARQQDYMNQLGLGQYQQGLAQLQPGLAQQNIGMLQQGNQQDLSYRQAIADTEAQSAKLAAYEPYQRYGFMGEQLTGIMGGYPGGTRMQTTPSASPMQQMMGMGIAGGLGYAGMQNLMG